MKRVIATVMVLTLIGSCRKNDGTPQLPVTYYSLSSDSLRLLQTDIPGDVYNDLCFVNEKTGFAVSANGRIVKTADGGYHWTELASNVSFNLTRIQFTDSQTGYITGGDATDGYLLKTVNAGLSWQKIALKLPEPGWPGGMFFLDAAKGFIVGKDFFRKTTDGGITWTEVAGMTAAYFTDISFKENKAGFATGAAGKYYTSSNGGDSWQPVQTTIDQALGKIFHAGTASFALTGLGLVDLATGKLAAAAVPAGATKLLFLNDKNCIGIGQHYESGFFPYGDVYLTNTAWQTSSRKTYQPFSEALNLKAMAKKGAGKILIIGQAVMGTPVIEFSY